MKTPLLLNIGTCFSASSPLHYTLGWDNKYCHTGHTKEHHWLYIKQIGKKAWGRRNSQRKRAKRRDEEKAEGGYLAKPLILTGENPLIKDKINVDEFYKGDYNIEAYIDYYEQLWDCIKYEYASCGDFSNQHFNLTEHFMMGIKDQLLEHFDLKFTVIFRDPIRRLFSACSKTCQHATGHQVLDERKDLVDPREYIKFCSDGALEQNCKYAETVAKFERVWGKDRVYTIIMEELWSSREKMNDLSWFLEFPLTKVHENCYYPDRGPNAPKYEYLKDQWCSNTVALDKETWEYVRKRLDPVYKKFERHFGYIPEEWGKWYET